MTTIVFLSAMVLGQCGPRGCPAPAVRPADGLWGYSVPTSFVAQDAAPMNFVPFGKPYYVVTNYRVNHEGVNFVVKGYFRSDTGKVTWEPSDPRNAASFAAAKAAAAARGARPVSVAAPAVVRPADRLVPAEPIKTKAVDVATNPFLGLPVSVQNFGLAPDKMRGNSTYTTTGTAAQRFVIEAQTPGDAVPKLHVTVIGSDDARAPVVNDLANHPEFAALKSHLMVQDYKPGEWPVDPSLGFVTTGKPTIIVQSARNPGDPRGGRVVYRANDYESGPKGLAEAIRKADPDYKPNADPGPATPGTPDACPLGFNRSNTPYLIGSCVLLFILFKLPRKEG